MNGNPEIEVLLATYNGERFLREQIDSILTQDYPDIRVLARDDGSSDGTPAILREYAAQFPDRFHVMPATAPAGGAKENFLLLMKASTASYICFADQDDVWLPDKVSQTMQAMAQLESQWGFETPLLVFTDLQVVDDELNILYKSFWTKMAIDPKWIHQFKKLLPGAVVTGSTMMLNRSLLSLSLRMPPEAFMHDRWISLLTSAFGKSHAVDRQTVLYRQHSSNVVGLGENAAPVPFLRRLRNANSPVVSWRRNQRQARSLLTTHGAEMPEDKREILKAFLRCETDANRFARVGLFFRHRFYTPGWLALLATLLHLFKADRSECAIE